MMNHNCSSCPICFSKDYSSAGSHFFKCKSCGTVFNSGFKILQYDDNYFLDEYKRQYGKTYIEDFSNIYRTSSLRLDFIRQIFKKPFNSELSILDIGSALGFFLKAAEDNGIKFLKGIEVSEFACNYCINEFKNIEVINSSFDEIDDPGKFDIITAWFFIEHCREPELVLKKIFRSLNDGGVFAFSVPSFFGPMFTLHRDQWIATHPQDHLIDLSPSSAKKILKSFGFKKVYVRAAGFHPDRIVKKSSFFYRPFSFLYRMFTRITGFSDTIEIYAVK